METKKTTEYCICTALWIDGVHECLSLWTHCDDSNGVEVPLSQLWFIHPGSPSKIPITPIPGVSCLRHGGFKCRKIEVPLKYGVPVLKLNQDSYKSRVWNNFYLHPVMDFAKHVKNTKQGAKTLLLCLNRVGIPKDIRKVILRLVFDTSNYEGSLCPDQNYRERIKSLNDRDKKRLKIATGIAGVIGTAGVGIIGTTGIITAVFSFVAGYFDLLNGILKLLF